MPNRRDIILANPQVPRVGPVRQGIVRLILIDEVLTPDSSQFWRGESVSGRAKNPPSFDKQFVRDWLETTSWDKNSSPPALPAEVIDKTQGQVCGGI